MISTFEWHHASRWRMTGSSARRAPAASATSRSSSVRNMIGKVAAASPRS